jgi:hypothetical protein
MVSHDPDGGSEPGPAARAGLRRAVEAWEEIAGTSRRPAAEPLRGGRHSVAVGLQTGDPSAPSVVAKVKPRGELDLERLIHEVILPGLGVDTPRFLGFVSGSDGESDVLFLEDVGRTPFEPFDRAHRDAAGRWLGRCHAASTRAPLPSLLPRRSLEEERVQLSLTRSGLAGTLDNPVLGEGGRSLLSSLLELLDSAARQWPEWAERCAAAPPVLTHGAFITRNVRMRGSGSELTTLPFDWDHVAVRSPAVDLARTSGRSRGFGSNASLETYRTALAASGLSLERDTVAALAILGTVVRAATCIGWEIGALAGEHAEQSLMLIAKYRRALEAVLVP